MKIDNKKIEFIDYMKECPCHIDGWCYLQVTYGHANHPIYSLCGKRLCPRFFRLQSSGIKKQKIKMVWTCSDYINHEHKYKFTAWLCGRIQYLKRLRLRSDKL